MRVILLIVAAIYAIVLATGLGVFDHGPTRLSNAFAYEYSTTITTSTTTSTSTSTTTPTSTQPGKGCGDKNHLHDRRFECKITISNVSKKEGNSGTTPFVFTVSVSGSPLSTVSVDWATGGGTATPVLDYVPANGTVSLPPGVMSATVTIQVVGDTIREPDETFFVNLSNPSPNAYIFGPPAIGTIRNDD
jgi:hypothetical protein